MQPYDGPRTGLRLLDRPRGGAYGKRMRPTPARWLLVPACMAVLAAACGSAPSPGFGGGSSSTSGGTGSSGGGAVSGSSGSSSGAVPGEYDGGELGGDGAVATLPAGDGSAAEQTTIYAHSDDTLYSMDPQTKATTLIGTFSGMGGASSADKSITNLAVNANGDVFVNTESVVYRATLPPAPPGTVSLTRVAALQTSDRFYALAFAPAGALDASSETLVGGDGNGELWAIDTTTGATTDLGHFGNDPSMPGHAFALSGDIVFYNDAGGKATGLATIRSCASGGSCGRDYLAGVDMNALKTAYAAKTPAATLLAGIYGGSSGKPGAGTGFADVFGLGAWQGTVFGFTRHTSASPPTLILIDTTTGAGKEVATFTFPSNNGWSGAGVTTKVTVSVPPPPPPQ